MIRRVVTWTMVAAVLLSGPLAWAPLAWALEKKVMVIGVDGMRPDQMTLANTPNLDALASGGSISLTAENVGPSWSGYSGPNWGSILTGVTPGNHGITFNYDSVHNIDDDNFGPGDIHSLFGLAKDHDPTLQTALLNSWPGIGVGGSTILEHSKTALDVKIAAGEYVEPGDISGDASIRDAVVDLMLGQGSYLGSGENPDLTFVHFDSVDGTGHGNDYDTPIYRAAIESVDAMIGDVVTAVNSRANIANEDWLYLVISDHGGAGFDHCCNGNALVRTVPYIVSGSSALQGADLGVPRVWDVAPTALQHLGVDVSSLSLDGSIVGLSPDVPSNASFNSVVDQDVLNIDFGVVGLGESVPDTHFEITNLPGAGFTYELDLVSVVGSGHTTTLTTDVSPFTDLVAGDTIDLLHADFETSGLGSYSATYDLNFTDDLGTNQTMTLNLSGVVENIDYLDQPDLVYDVTTGEVWLDPTDSGLIGYVLRSDGQFLSANHTAVLAGVTTSLPSELGEATLSSLASPASIGLVLPAGLDVEQVAALLTTNEASPSLGAPLTKFDIDLKCGAGDANCDGAVDISGDILQAFSNFTGPGTFSIVRADGDIEGGIVGDDDVDVSDILAMFGNFTGPLPDEGGLGAAEAGDPAIPDLIYDAATGEVTLDVDGAAGLIGYSLKSAGAFLAGGHTPILGGVSTSLSTELAEAALSTTSGSIGIVLPPGLDLASLTALLTTNEVSTGLGAPLVPFDLVVLAPAVPEPSTYVLAAMGLIALAAGGWRRRQRDEG